MSWVDITNKSPLTVAAMNAGAQAVEKALEDSNAPDDAQREAAVGMGIIFNGFPDPHESCIFGGIPETLPALRKRVDYFINDLSADLYRGKSPAKKEDEDRISLFETCANAALNAIEAHMAKKGPSIAD